eukprot:5488302-Ditylum_brightwellii.AAC.1
MMETIGAASIGEQHYGKTGPEEAVKDTGKALPHIFKHIEEAHRDSQIYFSKIDLADGYWRILVPDEHRWNFCYIMLDPPGHPVRVVVPPTLQMGWLQSAAFFCKATGTAKIIMDDLVQHNIPLPPTPLEMFFTSREEIKLALKAASLRD